VAEIGVNEMKDRIRIKGKVTVQVFDCNGKLKRHSPGFFRRLLGLPGKLMVQEFHNIVTREGGRFNCGRSPCFSHEDEGKQFKRLYSGGDWLDWQQHKDQYTVQYRNR